MNVKPQTVALRLGESMGRFWGRLGIVGIGFFLITCGGDSEPLGIGPTGPDGPPATDKSVLLEEMGNRTLRSAAAVTYEGTISNNSFAMGAGFQGDVPLNSINDPSLWDFWAFCATAGDQVTIEVHRTTNEMDPAMDLHEGSTTTTDGLSAGTSGSNPDLNHLVFADDNNGIPHGVGGSFADPRIVETLPSTGLYTLAVYDFIGDGPAPKYEIHMAGATDPGVPECSLPTGGLSCPEGVQFLRDALAANENAFIFAPLLGLILSSLEQGSELSGRGLLSLGRLMLRMGILTDAEFASLVDTVETCVGQVDPLIDRAAIE